MTARAARTPKRFAPHALTAMVLVATFALAPNSPARADDASCSGDACDGNAWQAARGDANQNSYWGMDPGHNCTNYVAWRLTLNGVDRPHVNPGNAADWATRAALDGYLVDNTATPGSVAQWDAFGEGNGVDGHVAYVEQVNPDGTILVSEDYWHDGDQLGPLTFRTISAANVSHFIHYGDLSHWLRQVQLTASGWQERSRGLSITPTAISMVTMTAAAPQLFYIQDGHLYQAIEDSTGWHGTNTGLASTSTSLSVVDMGKGTPQVLTLEGDRLFLNVSTGSGWQKMNTGVKIDGEISAVDLGGLLPTVMVAQAGTLYRVWSDMDGWHSESTGLESWGPISAVNVGGVHPEVYSIANNTLHRAWWDSEGWHAESTGVLASGSIVAVDAGGVAQVILTEDGAVFRAFQDAAGWHKEPTGVRAGSMLAAAGQGTNLPYIVQAD